MRKLELGVEAQDKITGFQGIITAKIEYLTGCDQYCLTPKTKDGEVKENNYFDAGRLEVTGNGILPETVQTDKKGGPNRDCPR